MTTVIRTYELVFEWNYKIQITKFAFVQPDIQWVIKPGGTGNIPNTLVLGRRGGRDFLGVTLVTAAGAVETSPNGKGCWLCRDVRARRGRGRRRTWRSEAI